MPLFAMLIYIVFQMCSHYQECCVCSIYNGVHLPFLSGVLYKYCGTDVHKAELSARPCLRSRLGTSHYCKSF
jgi:hypothetical protein